MKIYEKPRILLVEILTKDIMTGSVGADDPIAQSGKEDIGYANNGLDWW